VLNGVVAAKKMYNLSRRSFGYV